MPGGFFAFVHAVILGLLVGGLVFSYYASKVERRPGPTYAFGLLVAFVVAAIPFAILYNDARDVETFEFAFTAHALLSRGGFIAWIFYLHALTDFSMRWPPLAMYAAEVARTLVIVTHLDAPYLLSIEGIERVSAPFGDVITVAVASPLPLHAIQLVGSALHVGYAIVALAALRRLGRRKIAKMLAAPFLVAISLVFVDNLRDALGFKTLYLSELAYPLILFALTGSLMEWLLEGQRARSRVHEQEAQIARVLDSIADAVVLCDRSFRVLRTNPVARALEETPGADDLATRFGFVDPETGRPPEVRELLEEPKDLLAGTGRSARLVRVTAGEVRGQGEPVTGYVLVMHDITEHERRARLGRRDEKMRALGELAGSVAHDFNNYLAAIGASARMLERRGDDARSRGLVTARIGEAVDQAASLTRGLLGLSREGPTARAEPEILSVNDVVEKTGDLVRSVAGDRVDVSVELGAVADLVRGSAAELQSALFNLGKNAVDAIESRGAVRIRTTAATMPDRAPAIAVTVTDDGEGIAPENLERVFEPFFTTKPAGEGTGLGLPSVHRIVSEMGGSLDVESTLGVGTTVSLLFPLRETRERTAEKRVAEPEAPPPRDRA